MAKRRGRPARTFSIDGLLSTLADLDKQRQVITAQIKTTLESALSGVPSPFSPATRRGRPPGVKNVAATGGRKRRKMSAAQRKAVGQRMRKYWAERRKAPARVK